MAELPRIVNGRNPASQKIRPDAEHISGVGNVVNGKALPAQRFFRRFSLDGKIRQRTDRGRWRFDGFQERLNIGRLASGVGSG